MPPGCMPATRRKPSRSSIASIARGGRSPEPGRITIGSAGGVFMRRAFIIANLAVVFLTGLEGASAQDAGRDPQTKAAWRGVHLIHGASQDLPVLKRAIDQA